jgi:hypothetical protein
MQSGGHGPDVQFPSAVTLGLALSPIFTISVNQGWFSGFFKLDAVAYFTAAINPSACSNRRSDIRRFLPDMEEAVSTGLMNSSRGDKGSSEILSPFGKIPADYNESTGIAPFPFLDEDSSDIIPHMGDVMYMDYSDDKSAPLLPSAGILAAPQAVSKKSVWGKTKSSQIVESSNLRSNNVGLSVSVDARAFLWVKVDFYTTFWGLTNIQLLQATSPVLTLFSSLSVFGIAAPIQVYSLCLALPAFTGGNALTKASKPISRENGAFLSLGTVVSPQSVHHALMLLFSSFLYIPAGICDIS